MLFSRDLEVGPLPLVPQHPIKRKPDNRARFESFESFGCNIANVSLQARSGSVSIRHRHPIIRGPMQDGGLR